MNTSAKVPDDAPLLIAWKAYKQTKDYDNTLRWAKHFTISPDYDTGELKMTATAQEGSLWAAFSAGWDAALKVGERIALDAVDAACARVARPTSEDSK